MLETLLKTALTEALSPLVLEIDNESHGHNVPKNSETHFRVVLVSEAFVGLNRVKRHQLVYKLHRRPSSKVCMHWPCNVLPPRSGINHPSD